MRTRRRVCSTPIPTDGLTLADRRRAARPHARHDRRGAPRAPARARDRGRACRLSRRRQRPPRDEAELEERLSRPTPALTPRPRHGARRPLRARRGREDGSVARAHGEARRSGAPRRSPCRAGAIAPPPQRSRPTASRRSAPTFSIQAPSPRCPTRRTSSSWRDRSSARRAIPPRRGR